MNREQQVVLALTENATNSKGQRLEPSRLLETTGGQCGSDLDREALEQLAGQSILHPRQFDRRTVVALAKLAARLEMRNVEMVKPLDGKIAITAFFEPSTRTRLSFESAVMLLDGKVLSVPDGQSPRASRWRISARCSIRTATSSSCVTPIPIPSTKSKRTCSAR